MDRQAVQKRIDQVQWYHEFDFGNGLKSAPKTADIGFHHKVWSFIQHHLDRIDFRNKTVLDLGCWDGYWSFYAERRGAGHVLASDDASQNWAGSQGLLLARELLGSSVEVDLNRSVYDLASLGRKFDVILFLGVYYHIHDPFHALAQIRHCCHSGTVVVVEGDGIPEGVEAPVSRIDFSDLSRPIFCPTPNALRHLLRAAYFSVESAGALPGHEIQGISAAPPGRLGWRWRLKMALNALLGSRQGVADLFSTIDRSWEEGGRDGRLLMVCKPFEGENSAHYYKPPFGLDAYDNRFREKNAA